MTGEVMHYKEIIEAMGILDVAHEDMASLSTQDQAAFAMVRRSGLGASDSSIYLGVNKWKTVDDLIRDKRSIGLTPEEIEVGNKEVVRKGRDLEPIILQKFAEQFGIEVIKPTPMYRIVSAPQLTINFDGVISVPSLIPVEAKYVSPFADRYWDKTKATDNLYSNRGYIVGGDLITHIEDSAKLYGIPPYYYTQIQQQMMGLDAPFGFFAALFDKGWDFKAFYVERDVRVQAAIIEESKRVWSRIKES